MRISFVDDSRQSNPSRPEMGSLVAVGSIHVDASVIATLEERIGIICSEAGFPTKEEFKWSPGRELWMHDNLRDEGRRDFFIQVLDEVKDKGGRALVVVEDVNRTPANRGRDAEEDVIIMLLERIEREFQSFSSEGIIISDRPAGGRSDEDKFLIRCLETIQYGTDYVKPVNIIINVLSTPSKLVRLLQVADLITSCTLARVGGEREYSPDVFVRIKEMMAHEGDRIGGYGLKIQPAFRYANLYYWLLGDSHFWYRDTGYPLPRQSNLYSAEEYLPWS